MDSSKFQDMDGMSRAEPGSKPPKKPEITDVWADQLKQRRQQAVKKVKQQAETAVKTVEIKISLPSDVKLPAWLKDYKLLWNKLSVVYKATPRPVKLITGGLAGFIILVLVVTSVLGGGNKNQAQADAKNTKPGQTVTSPGYATLLPAGKNIKDLGGWTRVSPSSRNPVYAYVDHINNVRIDVSEQPLPDSFLNNTDTRISQLAQGYGATGKITVGQTNVDIGEGTGGAQTVIFTKAAVLFLIRSAAAINNNDWAAYIDSLVGAG